MWYVWQDISKEGNVAPVPIEGYIIFVEKEGYDYFRPRKRFEFS
jgi:hypothetical protein